MRTFLYGKTKWNDRHVACLDEDNVPGSVIAFKIHVKTTVYLRFLSRANLDRLLEPRMCSG